MRAGGISRKKQRPRAVNNISVVGPIIDNNIVELYRAVLQREPNTRAGNYDYRPSDRGPASEDRGQTVYGRPGGGAFDFKQ